MTLGAPSNLRAVATAPGRVHLTWLDNASGETGFRVERATGAGDFAQIDATVANATFYADTTTQDATLYRYRVRAAGSGGTFGSYSNEATVETPPDPPDLVFQVAWTSAPFAASPSYVDESAYVRRDQPARVIRGRNTELGRFEAGSLSLLLDNRTRRFDPLYAAGPLYGYITPRRRCRLGLTYRGATTWLFTGFARFRPRSAPGRDNLVEVAAVDALDWLGRATFEERQVTLQAWNYSGAWQPGNTLDSIVFSPAVQVLDGAGGVLRVRTDWDAYGTFGDSTGISVEGTRASDGAAVNESFTIGAGNNDAGVLGSVVFRTITRITSGWKFGATGYQPMVIIAAFPSYGALAGVQRGDIDIDRMLSYVGYPLKALGQGDIGIADVWAPSAGSTVLAAMQRVEATEQGQVFVRGDGAVVFEPQGVRRCRYDTQAPLLGSGADEIPCTVGEMDDGDDYVTTRARLTRLSGWSESADAPSTDIDASGLRVLSRSTLHRAAATGSDYVMRAEANRTVARRKTATPRLRGVTIPTSYATCGTAAWNNTGGLSDLQVALGLDISSAVVVRMRPPNVGTHTDIPCFVERVEWHILGAGRWELGLGLSPAALENDRYALRATLGREFVGMAFPTTNLYSGLRYIREDLGGKECRYDGTQWLTVQEDEVSPLVAAGAQPLTTAGTVGSIPRHGSYNRLITALRTSYYVATTNNGSNYWTINLIGLTSYNSIASISTAASGANTWIHDYDSTLSNANNNEGVTLSLTKTGSPGGIYLAATICYRLIIV